MEDFNKMDFTDTSKYNENIILDKDEGDEYIADLKVMLTIRSAERRLADAKKEGLIKGPVHLSVGQEAIATGISKYLLKTDMVFGGHRSHAHLLSLGSPLYPFFLEVLAKKGGLSKGMGGSMHLWDESNGFMGSTPIVSGTVPLALGAGLAASLTKTDRIAVTYMGDGAVEEGVVHESFNLAKLMGLPVLFVIENNLFASHMHISQRQPNIYTARFAEANAIPFRVVDGNNIKCMSEAANCAIKSIRSGGGPQFIEAITYRWYGHVDWREDIDVGVSRSLDDIKAWKGRDPLERLKNGLIEIGMLTEQQYETIQEGIRENVDAQWHLAFEEAQDIERPITENVYSKTE